MITEELVAESIKKVAQYETFPVTISPKGMYNAMHTFRNFISPSQHLDGFKDLGEALTKPRRTISGASDSGPPSVSSSELTKRFKVKVLQEGTCEVPFSCFFKPPLHEISEPAHEKYNQLVQCLKQDVNVVCAVAEAHYYSRKAMEGVKHYVSN